LNMLMEQIIKQNIQENHQHENISSKHIKLNKIKIDLNK
jgi:hypothetical protein